MKVERPSLMREPHYPAEPLFHQDVPSPNRVVNLIELPRMRDGEVLPQTAGGLEAQTSGQVSDRWLGPMQIGRLGGRHHKAPVIVRQILLQEAVGRLKGSQSGPGAAP